MRRVAMLVLSLTCSLGMVERGFAGPFGLSMGMQPSEVGGTLKKQDAAGVYRANKVPTPYSAFRQYDLQFGPTTGLCRIQAVGLPLKTSADGMELRIAFTEMEERLKAQYGEYKRDDFLNAESIWKDSHDFMIGMVKKERTLTARWSAADGSTLKEDLREITITAQAPYSDEGYISVTYKFQNIQECEKELKVARDGALFDGVALAYGRD
jgi:hypothetical protein